MEIEKVKEENEKERQAQLKKEIRALREKEANERKQREAEEAKRREAEELAKRFVNRSVFIRSVSFSFLFRHKEMAAAMAPSLPAVREEEDETTIVEFGNTELHRQAAHKGKENKTLKFSFDVSFQM